MKMEILFLIFVIEGCTLEWAGVKLHRPIHGNMPLQIYSHDKSWIVAIYLPYYILKIWNYISLFFTIHISFKTIYNCLSIIISSYTYSYSYTSYWNLSHKITILFLALCSEKVKSSGWIKLVRRRIRV